MHPCDAVLHNALDRLVLKKVFGVDPEGRAQDAIKFFSTDISAAFEIVAHLHERWLGTDQFYVWNLKQCGFNMWKAAIVTYDDQEVAYRIAMTLPLAICKAALAWVEHS